MSNTDTDVSYRSPGHTRNEIESDPRKRPRDISNVCITLRQWRVLHAVYEGGSLAEAGERIHVSQPTITYTLSRLEEQLGISVYKIEGRKAALTETGKKLLERSRRLLEEAAALEEFAKGFRQEHRRTAR